MSSRLQNQPEAPGPDGDSEHRWHAGAWRDFKEGPLLWRVWMSLGMHDIRLRYKRTVLGPIWIAIGTAVSFVLIAMVFSAVLKADIRQFLPYLGAGMIVWTYLSAVANEGPRIFTDAHHLIDSLRLPLTVHVLRCVWRNGIIFAHNLVVFLAVAAAVGLYPTPALLSLLYVLPLLMAALYFAALILAMAGARFRDIAQAVGIVMQLAFFMTPILWSPDDIPLGRKYWIALNPLHHMIEILRAPLTGQSVPLPSLAVTAGLCLALGLTSFFLFRALRHRVSYWL